jgi:hypothetical protein
LVDFTVGEGRVLGLEIREGGPARLGGTPVLFRKVGIRPEAWFCWSACAASRLVTSNELAVIPRSWRPGVADGQSPPLAWDAEKSVNVRWSTPIPGLGHSSPIIWGDRIFLTTSAPYRIPSSAPAD